MVHKLRSPVFIITLRGYLLFSDGEKALAVNLRRRLKPVILVFFTTVNSQWKKGRKKLPVLLKNALDGAMKKFNFDP